jgi:hypothetical protein
LYTSTIEYIIYGDLNIDYLVDSDRTSQLEALLKTYNLTSVVNFSTRTQQNSATLLTISLLTLPKWGTCPIINGLSDHDAQSITLHSFNLSPPTKKVC